MESKKINQLATELTPALSDLTIIGDPTTGISKKITLSQMASLFTGTVEEYANLAAFPLVGVADTIYIALDTNVLYRWNTGTSAYVELSPNIINSLVFSDANGFDGNISLVGSVATLTITTALTTGSVPFIGASGALSQDNANLFFDDTNNRLGINTNAPTTALDVFGSGIIGRINGTSTNNAFLGFSSAGTNKWSIGNVQSDHRFRIYNEATTSELVSVLSTGEFGIGIANPTTKLHIDGGANALIANLDANVSVAKSISFRSDNSNRFNIEVSGTESGSNAGADFFIRRYSDAGSLIDTPLTITRSTGAISLATTLNLSEIQASTSAGITLKSNGGTSIALFGAGGGAGATLYGGLIGTSANFSGNLTIDTDTLFVDSTNNRVGIGTTSPTNPLHIASNSVSQLNIAALSGNTNAQINLEPTGTGVAIIGPASAYPLIFRTDATERLRITSGGNVGIGVTPSAWFTGGGYKVLELGVGLSLDSGNDFRARIASNAFVNSGGDWTYRNTSQASNYTQFQGNHIWETAPSGTAGSAITFTERMRIRASGSVGIGTAGEDSVKFEVKAASTSSLNYAVLFQDSNAADLMYVRADGLISTGLAGNSPYNLVRSGRVMMVDSSGLVGYQSSTRESKTNINNLEDISFIYQLNPVSFNYRKSPEPNVFNDEYNDDLHYGLIADEVEKVNKELVFYNEKDGQKELAGVEYGKLTAVLIKAIQEQQAQIEELKALINK